MENLLDDIISAEKFKNKSTETDEEYLNDQAKKYVKDYAFTMNDELTFSSEEYPTDMELICKAAKELGFKTEDKTVYFNIKTIGSKAELISSSVISFKNDIIREINENIKMYCKRRLECNEIFIKIDFFKLLYRYGAKYMQREHYSLAWLAEKLEDAGYKSTITFDDYTVTITLRLECK
jgi:hypothetical protein